MGYGALAKGGSIREAWVWNMVQSGRGAEFWDWEFGGESIKGKRERSESEKELRDHVARCD